MSRASVDTPWQTTVEDGNFPQLVQDPAFASLILGWTDVTGAEGVEVEPGKVLYGGNYAKVTGIQPDYSIGRLGGSGDPDWLTIQIIFDEVAHPTLLADIDALDEYSVYWDEVDNPPEGARAAQSSYRDKDSKPDAAAWGMFRSKMARRGYTDEFMEQYAPTEAANTWTWGEADLSLRRGYILGQTATVLDLSALAEFLSNEGWVASSDASQVSVEDNGNVILLVISYLMGCDFSDLNNQPLANDLCDAMKAQGFCSGGCS